MNERGKDVLINAQLQGVKQIRGKLYDGEGGFCAGGVLLKEAGIIGEYGWFFKTDLPSQSSISKLFGMNQKEWERMVDLNNSGADFIKIARELPDTE